MEIIICGKCSLLTKKETERYTHTLLAELRCYACRRTSFSVCEDYLLIYVRCCEWFNIQKKEVRFYAKLSPYVLMLYAWRGQ